MFGKRYFGNRYFGCRYFGNCGAAAVAATGSALRKFQNFFFRF